MTSLLDLVNVTGSNALGLIIWLLIGSGVIQWLPIKVNPWSIIGKKIGRAINGEVIEKVDNLEESVTRLRGEMDEDRAVTARVRILRFNDELLESKKHSKESFDQCLSDIDNYEQYCEDHHEFKNNKTIMAVGNIKKCYERCLENHDFL